MDNDRIGGLGVNAVTNYILNSGFMKPDIRHHDNIPIWDGDIYVYSNEDDLKNNNFCYRVPTQVKSHFYQSEDEFPLKASFPIEVNNLYNYFAEGGVVFFVVYVRKYESQIYVSYLTKSKIKKILKGKETQSSITISLPKITSDETVFLNELYSFNLQRRFTTKPLVDFDPKETIEIIFDRERYGLENAPEEDINRYLASHSVDLLFKTADSEIFYPEEGRVSLSNVTESVGQIKFGTFEVTTLYKKITTAHDYLYIVENGWLTLTKPFDSSEFVSLNLNYKFSTFRTAVRTAFIMDSLLKTNTVSFGEDVLVLPPYDKEDPSFKSLKRSIDFWLRFNRLCEILHIYHDFDVDGLTDEDIEKFNMLYDAYVEKKEVTTSIAENHLTLTVIKDLRVVSLVKVTHDNKARLVDFSEQLLVAYRSDESPEKQLLATPFTAAFAYDKIPSNIQLDNICASYTEALKHNPLLVDRANLDLLNLINHYDKTNRNELLKAAKQLSDWIQANCSSEFSHIYRLNSLQIMIRMQQTISEEDKEWLSARYDSTDNNSEKFVCAVLLKEYYRAERIFKILSKEEQSTVSTWPIMNLYKEQHNG
jgi:hypothetical protein